MEHFLGTPCSAFIHEGMTMRWRVPDLGLLSLPEFNSSSDVGSRADPITGTITKVTNRIISHNSFRGFAISAKGQTYLSGRRLKTELSV